MEVGFSNSGQVDWIGLADKAVTLPINMLSRYSQAGIQPHTVEFCKTLGETLRYVKLEHLEHVEKQLTRSKFIGISSNLFYIGTGTSVIPKQIAATRGGVAFATVAFALRSCFNDLYTRDVLDNLINNLRPEGLSVPSPSSMQISVLTNEICAHVKDKGFLDLVRTVTNMTLQGLGNDTEPRQPTSDDMAQTIAALFTISPGSTIIIRAASDMVLWLAAFCHWYLGHQVSLYVDGELIWENVSYVQQNRKGPVPSIIFKTIAVDTDGDLESELEDAFDEIEIYSEAKIEILLERHDRLQGSWHCRVELDELTYAVLGNLDDKHSEAILTTFQYFLAYTLSCRICSYDVDDNGLVVADMVTKDRLESVLKYLFGKLPEQKAIELLASVGWVLDNFKSGQSVPLKEDVLQDMPPYVKSVLFKLLESVLILIFTDIKDFSLVLVEKSWAYKTTRFGQAASYNNWLKKRVFHSDILGLVWRLFETDLDMNQSRIQDVSQFEYLGASSRGLYGILPFALNLDLGLPPSERLRVQIGEGAIYVNGSLVTHLRGTEFSTLKTNQAERQEKRNPYWTPNRQHFCEISNTVDSTTKTTVDPYTIARKAPITYTLKQWVSQASADGVFNFAWTVVVRTYQTNKLLFDRQFNPYELITRNHDLWRARAITQEAEVSQVDKPIRVFFFNICDIFHLSQKWLQMMEETDCFILCCRDDVGSDAISRLMVPDACWVAKDLTETTEEFCHRVHSLQQQNVPEKQLTEPSHIGVIRF